ncbi:MAG: GNAT family N-acetyltransferase, partial [Vulcanimicrobiaceae bacterium]
MGLSTELFGVDDGARMREALAIRVRVFVEEQGVPAEEEVDAHDRDDPRARHALARLRGRALGAGRFYVLG